MQHVFSASDIIKKFAPEIIRIIGNVDAKFDTSCSVNDVLPNSIIWLNTALFKSFISSDKTNRVSVIITDCDEALDLTTKPELCVIVAKKSKLLYIECLKYFFEIKPVPGIHSTAFISPNAIIGENVYVGPFCYIGNNTSVGDNCVLEGNNFIYDNVHIGKRVILQAGVVVGSRGMSLARKEDNSLVAFPCLGKVLIEDDVEIGSNSTIDQSILEQTIIGRGTIVNSLVFIGNSVKLGKNNFVAGGVNINGSVQIGDNNFIGSGSTIRNKIIIGSENTIGAGAVVVKNIENKATVMGNPAKESSKSKGVKL
jgi:UDP-3-O-[3-hydroxymyristoyl] glucosamine N-acyltransferase